MAVTSAPIGDTSRRTLYGGAPYLTRLRWGVWLVMALGFTPILAAQAPENQAIRGEEDAAHPRGVAAVLIYADDNDTSVIKTTTAGSASHGGTTASASVGFDFITAASVDLVTAASPRGFTERRTQVDCGLDHNFGAGTRLTGGYNVSHEPDFLTHAVRLGGQYELFDRHLIVTGGYGLSFSAIGRRNDSVFRRDRHSHDLSLAVTRIVTRNLALDLSYGVSLVRGFQANAYRYVRLYAPTSAAATSISPTSPHQTAVAERTPDQRARHTLVGRLRWRPLPTWFVHAGYRIYADTWGMTAHTGTLRALWSPGSGQWSIALRGRGHVQSAVAFYRRYHTTFPLVPALRTADKELGPLWTGLVGLQVEWSPHVAWADGLHVGAGADWLHIRYLDYAFLKQRNALLVTIDVTLEL